MDEIYKLLAQVKDNEPLLEDIKETLKIIVSPDDTTFSYKDLFPYVEQPVPEEKRRIFELLKFYDYKPSLTKVNRKLVLKLNKRQFLWCRSKLKILSAGWMYLLYSKVLECWKVGMTESTMVRRLTNYKKDEKWTELHSKFCRSSLQLKEIQLKNYCNSKYEGTSDSSSNEHFNLHGDDDVNDIKLFIDFLCV